MNGRVERVIWFCVKYLVISVFIVVVGFYYILFGIFLFVVFWCFFEGRERVGWVVMRIVWVRYMVGRILFDIEKFLVDFSFCDELALFSCGR